jgi:hypothetical protein
MRANLVLTAIVLTSAVTLMCVVPVSIAHGADHCLGLVGELDVVARSCAFSRTDAVAPLALWPALAAFVGTSVGIAGLRRGILKSRRGGRSR